MKEVTLVFKRIGDNDPKGYISMIGFDYVEFSWGELYGTEDGTKLFNKIKEMVGDKLLVFYYEKDHLFGDREREAVETMFPKYSIDYKIVNIDFEHDFV